MASNAEQIIIIAKIKKKEWPRLMELRKRQQVLEVQEKQIRESLQSVSSERVTLERKINALMSQLDSAALQTLLDELYSPGKTDDFKGSSER